MTDSLLICSYNPAVAEVVQSLVSEEFHLNAEIVVPEENFLPTVREKQPSVILVTTHRQAGLVSQIKASPDLKDIPYTSFPKA